MIVLVIVIILVIACVVFMLMTGGNKGKTDSAVNMGKEQAQIIKDATRKLSKNADNADALLKLSEVYFSNGLWEKALPLFKNMVRIAPLHPEIDVAKANLRLGICHTKMEYWEEALNAFLISYSKDSQNYDINYYMGYTYTKLKAWDKAIPLLKKSMIINPLAEGVSVLLGKCFYEQKHFREAIPYFKMALNTDPNNKETQFLFADSLTEDGHGDKALKLFERLRTDPTYGARSCLRAGVYHGNQGNRDGAEKSFLIGLKLPGTPVEIQTELRYRLALCYFEQLKFNEGLKLLQEIRQVNPQYKDINALITRYQELTQNTNLQVYLSGSVGDFAALVRRMTEVFYKNGIVKILDVNIGSIYTDVLAEVDIPGRDRENQMFRYFRTNGQTGELYVRELHDSLHERRGSSKGICLTAGVFTEETRRYVEGRPIDLVERDKMKIVLKAAN